MKRFVGILFFALGVLPVALMAEVISHAPGSSQIKRAVADPGGSDFSSRAYQINNACDVSRTGAYGGGAAAPTGGAGAGGAGGGDLLEAQLPTGAINDTFSG